LLADPGGYAAEGASALVIESRAFIDRTITAQTFVGLLKTEALQFLVMHHFSPAEIVSIERSIRRASREPRRSCLATFRNLDAHGQGCREQEFDPGHHAAR
jgi:hypothetical protein